MKPIALLFFVSLSLICPDERSTLSFSLIPDHTEYYSGERIQLLFTIENKSSAPQNIVVPIFREWLGNVSIKATYDEIPIELNKGIRVDKIVYDIKSEIKSGGHWRCSIPFSFYFDVPAPQEKGHKIDVEVRDVNGNIATCSFTVMPIEKIAEIVTVQTENPLHTCSTTDHESLPARHLNHGIVNVTLKAGNDMILACSEDNASTGGWIRLYIGREETIRDKKIFLLETILPDSGLATDRHFNIIPYSSTQHMPQREKSSGDTASKNTRPVMSCFSVCYLWITEEGLYVFIRGRHRPLPYLVKDRPDIQDGIHLWGLRPFTFEDLVTPTILVKDNSFMDISGVDIKNGISTLSIKTNKGSFTTISIDALGKIREDAVNDR